MDIGTGIIVSFVAAALGEIVDVGLPESEVVTVDTSHHGTVGGKTYIPGDLIENGELKVDMALVAGALLVVGTVGEVIITFPDATVWTFSGICQKNSPTAPLEETAINSVIFKVSGNIVVT